MGMITSDWMMVFITSAYALTTIVICVINALNNGMVKKQAIDSNIHQKQNAGIQLYSLRKNVLANLDKRNYDEIYWDVALLYNPEINKQFLELADTAHKLEAMSSDLKFYERFLVNNMDAAEFASFKVSSASGKQSDYEDCVRLVSNYDKSVSICVDGETKQLNYRELLENKHAYSMKVDAMRLNLSVQMQQFIKDSIT